MAVKLAVAVVGLCTGAGLTLVPLGMWLAWHPLGLIAAGAELLTVAYVAQDQLGSYMTRRN